MNNLTSFRPPYLDFSNAQDLEKIRDKIETLRDLSFSKKVRTSASNLANPKKSEAVMAKITNTPTNEINSVTRKTIATPQTNITPNGNVPLEFNCVKTFHADNDFTADSCYWDLRFKNPATGTYEQVKYLGETSTSGLEKHSITFLLDYSAYNIAAYQNNNGAVDFVIGCSSYNWGVPYINVVSSPVTLNFKNTPACIGIKNVSLNTDSVEGGNNAPNPVLTVYIDAPAPPGGQAINLSVDNSNLGNIMGTTNPSFYIAAGQMSGSISWFLGTRRVYSTGKSLNIIIEIPGTSSKATANVTLTKKKK